MQALLQRVSEARVIVDGEVVGQIGAGLLIFICAECDDRDEHAARLLEKIIKLRIFSDEAGKMNRSVTDVSGALLIVSQFTLAADTAKGNRPSFGMAAEPGEARRLYDRFVALACETGLSIKTGVFAADMQVSLINDGPVTVPLAVRF